MTESLSEQEYAYVERLLRYQFGDPMADTFGTTRPITVVHRSRSGRIDRLFTDDGRLGTITTAGRLTLGYAGASMLHTTSEPPAHRVVVADEAVPFIADGKNAFAKFVVRVDPRIRPRDEVLLVDRTDALVGIGRATLAAEGMVSFARGMAVDVRIGRDRRPASPA